jgi:hypothetical protein
MVRWSAADFETFWALATVYAPNDALARASKRQKRVRSERALIGRPRTRDFCIEGSPKKGLLLMFNFFSLVSLAVKSTEELFGSQDFLSLTSKITGCAAAALAQ